MKSWLWSGKPWQAFKTFAILFSFTVNFVLIIVLLLAAPLILPIVGQIAVPIVGGLNQSFVDMGDARIERTIHVDDTLPIAFDVPLSTETTVRLTQPVPLSVPATMVLPGDGGSINGTVSLNLPAGLDLPVALNLIVPVDQQVPVQLDVGVDIPLNETDLGQPFGNLQAIFTPLDKLLTNLPGSNEEFFDRLRSSGNSAAIQPDNAQASNGE
ncbi:MAG: hypothetical protein WAM60_13365 [Candidatus Promineifilaceae bacterium]